MAYLVTRWLHEAPEEEENQAPAEAPEGAEGEAPPEGEGEEGGDDENFDIDTSLDAEEDDTPPEEGEDPEGGGEPSDAGDDLEGGSAPAGESEGEANPANTNIFPSLTAEEQQVKIGELKKLYKDLYSSVNDLLHRIDNIDMDEDIMDTMTKVSNILHKLQNSIADYFENIFDIRSYFENDVKYNEFLLVLKKTTTVVDDLSKSREKRLGKNATNIEDKNNNI